MFGGLEGSEEKIGSRPIIPNCVWKLLSPHLQAVLRHQLLGLSLNSVLTVSTWI